MYPFLRAAKVMVWAHRQPTLEIADSHVSHHICWPIDLDMFREMNNGRMLSIFDLGRFGYAVRIGLIPILRANGWGLVAAGSSIRYRRRLRGFDRFTMHTRVVGRDPRFIYFDQSMWRRGEAVSNLLVRTAVSRAGGVVPTDEVGAALGAQDWNPALPDWVAAWIAAEQQRAWPPAI